MDNIGALMCEDCPIGFYQNGAGKRFCHRCPEGSITLRTGATNLGDCHKSERLPDLVYFSATHAHDIKKRTTPSTPAGRTNGKCVNPFLVVTLASECHKKAFQSQTMPLHFQGSQRKTLFNCVFLTLIYFFIICTFYSRSFAQTWQG